MPRDPILFISHKHTDRAIADKIREFVYEQSHREVSVFQSSSADAEGPELGRMLATDLKTALWQSGLVILVYTTEDQDWQWCMWECGVATNPSSPDTRTIVFQCASQAPRVFQDAVRVNAREREDILKFTRAFLTDPEFFPGFGGAIAPKLERNGDEVRKAAEALAAALDKVMPKSEVAEWAAQPLIQLQLPLDLVDQVAAEQSTPTGNAIEIADVTLVTSLDSQARQIFGLADLAPGTTLSGLGLRWAEKVPGAPLDWLRDIEGQVRRAARNELPAIGWGYLQDTDSPAQYVPLLSRARKIPALRCIQFDVNLVPFDEFAVTRVAARMIPLEEVVCHRVEAVPLESLKVVDLARRFREERLTRMPFLRDHNRVQLMVHRSMIDRFIAEQATSDGAAQLPTVTLAELMAREPDLKRMFESSFGAVASTARLRDVRSIMAADKNVQDVFVTATGKRDDPILGWLTNTMLAQHLV